jgi:hypothetical protein
LNEGGEGRGGEGEMGANFARKNQLGKMSFLETDAIYAVIRD